MDAIAKDFIAFSDPTQHDCDNPADCSVPTWWQDHCSMYLILARYQNAHQDQSARCAELVNELSTMLSPTPSAQPLQTAVSVWLRNPAIDMPLRQWVSEQFPQCRITGAPTTLRRRPSDTRNRQVIADAEGALYLYYQGRVIEAIRRFESRTALTPAEAAELSSYGQEAFLRVLRRFDLTQSRPLQPWLRTNLPRRMTDVLFSDRELGRAITNYEVECGRYRQEHPEVTSRAAAAAALGTYSPDRIEEYETLITLRGPVSLEATLDPERFEPTRAELGMAPISSVAYSARVENVARYLPKEFMTIVDGIDPQMVHDALSEADFTPEELDTLVALAYGELEHLAAERNITKRVAGIQAKQVMAKLMEVATRARRAYEQMQLPLGTPTATTTGGATPLRSTVDQAVAEASLPTPAVTLPAITRAQVNELVRAYVTGDLDTTTAARSGLDLPTARSVAITALEAHRCATASGSASNR